MLTKDTFRDILCYRK